jgi:hypothetical protein
LESGDVSIVEIPFGAEYLRVMAFSCKDHEKSNNSGFEKTTIAPILMPQKVSKSHGTDGLARCSEQLIEPFLSKPL